MCFNNKSLFRQVHMLWLLHCYTKSFVVRYKQHFVCYDETTRLDCKNKTGSPGPDVHHIYTASDYTARWFTLKSDVANI